MRGHGVRLGESATLVHEVQVGDGPRVVSPLNFGDSRSVTADFDDVSASGRDVHDRARAIRDEPERRDQPPAATLAADLGPLGETREQLVGVRLGQPDRCARLLDGRAGVVAQTDEDLLLIRLRLRLLPRARLVRVPADGALAG
jgi:hypothetical protein